MDVKSVVEAYQALGFFEGKAAADVVARYRAAWGDQITDAWTIEQLVFYQDEARVWHADLECDAFEGEDRYVEWARGLSTLGGLAPVEAKETWHPPETGDDRVELVLREGSKTERRRTFDSGDYINPAPLMDAINTLRRRHARRLVAVDTGGQDTCIMLVSRAEERAVAARGWHVLDLSAAADGALRGAQNALRAALTEWWRAWWRPFRLWRALRQAERENKG